MDEIKKALASINKIFAQQKKYCEYSGCIVQCFEHHHINAYTVTFLSPQELEKIKNA